MTTSESPASSASPTSCPPCLNSPASSSPAASKPNHCCPLVRGETDRLHDIIITSPSLSDTAGSTTRIVDDSERVVVEVSPSTIRDGKWDFLYSLQNEPIELYDARRDPAHQRNLADQNRDICEMMHAKFVDWMDKMDTPSKNTPPPAASSKTPVTSPPQAPKPPLLQLDGQPQRAAQSPPANR